MTKKNKYLLLFLIALGTFPYVQAQSSSSNINMTVQSESGDVLFEQEGNLAEEEDAEGVALALQEKEEKLKEDLLFSIALQTKQYINIDYYLQNGFSINKELYDGNTAAQVSAFHMDSSLLNYIAEKKANLNHLNKNSESILYWGSAGKSVKYLETAKSLLSKDFNSLMTTTTKTGRTPLHAAVLYAGNIDVINWLIFNKIDMNAKDSNGQTAMHYAAVSRRWDILEFLLKKGASINEVDKDGRSVEDYLFEKLEITTIDIFHPYVSKEKKIYIEDMIATKFPEKLLKINPKYSIVAKKIEKEGLNKEEFISGKEVIK